MVTLEEAFNSREEFFDFLERRHLIHLGVADKSQLLNYLKKYIPCEKYMGFIEYLLLSEIHLGEVGYSLKKRNTRKASYRVSK